MTLLEIILLILVVSCLTNMVFAALYGNDNVRIKDVAEYIGFSFMMLVPFCVPVIRIVDKIHDKIKAKNKAKKAAEAQPTEVK